MTCKMNDAAVLQTGWDLFSTRAAQLADGMRQLDRVVHGSGLHYHAGKIVVPRGFGHGNKQNSLGLRTKVAFSLAWRRALMDGVYDEIAQLSVF